MAHPKNKRPAARSTAVGAQVSFANSTPYHQKNQPDNDAIWDACREAQNATTAREVQKANRLKSAALGLGRFKQNESGQWVYRCSECEREMKLFTANNGDVQAYYSGCGAYPGIQQWLRDKGFRS
jgi:hypothetical protein